MQKRMAVKILSMKIVKTQKLELTDWTRIERFADAAANMIDSSLSNSIIRVVIPWHDFTIADFGI